MSHNLENNTLYRLYFINGNKELYCQNGKLYEIYWSNIKNKVVEEECIITHRAVQDELICYAKGCYTREELYKWLEDDNAPKELGFSRE